MHRQQALLQQCCSLVFRMLVTEVNTQGTIPEKETSTSLALVGELQDGANPTQAQL